MRDDRERLRDILEAIAQIEKYAIQGYEAFDNDELLQIWVIHHLQIVGEASRSLSNGFIAQHTDVPWASIIEFRNILVHEYFRINPDIVWSIIERDLPDFKTKVEIILQAVENE